MKHFFISFLMILLIACNSSDSDVLQLQEQAKKDTIEKLKLPDGTQFRNESITINKAEGTEEDSFEIYAVTIIVHSQDENGYDIEKPQVLLYKKVTDDKNKSSFQLLSFE